MSERRQAGDGQGGELKPQRHIRAAVSSGDVSFAARVYRINPAGAFLVGEAYPPNGASIEVELRVRQPGVPRLNMVATVMSYAPLPGGKAEGMEVRWVEASSPLGVDKLILAMRTVLGMPNLRPERITGPRPAVYRFLGDEALPARSPADNTSESQKRAVIADAVDPRARRRPRASGAWSTITRVKEGGDRVESEEASGFVADEGETSAFVAPFSMNSTVRKARTGGGWPTFARTPASTDIEQISKRRSGGYVPEPEAPRSGVVVNPAAPPADDIRPLSGPHQRPRSGVHDRPRSGAHGPPSRDGSGFFRGPGTGSGAWGSGAFGPAASRSGSMRSDDPGVFRTVPVTYEWGERLLPAVLVAAAKDHVVVETRSKPPGKDSDFIVNVPMFLEERFVTLYLWGRLKGAAVAQDDKRHRFVVNIGRIERAQGELGSAWERFIGVA